MSTTIDERVVEMRFDNKHFESNVSTTMSTLDKLKQKLNLSGASKGLEGVNTAARKVDLSGISAGAETVGLKFNAMYTIADQALRNITNSAMAAGKRIVSALTIDPVKTGFSEYETQINATQTILSNTKAKGSTIDDVNTALEELNKYADKTIYNFTEMTRNIGTFTAAGIELETSVNAIQGIANLAAVSGSTSQQASTAMYQLSQALASGTVKLMDWNSVVNAGMGGEMFQNALKETSELLGTGAQAAIDARGSFRESLRDGWLTAEVLTETLKKFTTTGANERVAEYTGLSKEAVEAALESAKAQYGEAEAIEYASKALAEKSGKSAEEIKSTLEFAKDAEDAATKVKTLTQLWDVMKESAQSGWAQSWKIIIGDFESAKALFTPLADFLTGIINNMSEWRNTILEGVFNAAAPFTELFNRIESVTKATEAVTKATVDYSKIVDEVIAGKWKNAPTRWEDLAAAGYDWAHVQNLVNERLGCSVRHATNYTEAQEEAAAATAVTVEQLLAMSDAELKNLGFTEDEIKALKELAKVAEQTGLSVKDILEDPSLISGRSLLINAFKNIGKAIGDVAKTIAQAWEAIFNPSGKSSEEKMAERVDSLYGMIAAFHKFTTNLTVTEETADKLTRTFKGVFAILDLITTILGGGFKIAFKIITSVLSYFNLDILEVTAVIGDAIVAFHDWIESFFDLSKVLDVIVPWIKKAYDWIASLFEKAKESGVLDNFIERVKSIASAIQDWFAGLKDAEILDKLIERVKVMSEAIREWYAGLKETDNVPQYILNTIKNGLKAGWSAISSGLSSFGAFILAQIKKIPGMEGWIERFEEGVRAFKEYIGGALEPVREWFEGLKEAENIPKYIIEGLLNGLKTGVGLIWDAATSVAEAIVEAVKTFLDINSPSGVFITIGGFIIAGLLLGLQNGLGDVGDTLKGGLNSSLETIGSIDFAGTFKDIVAKCIAGVKTIWASLWDILGDLAAEVKEFVDGLGVDWGTLLAGALASGLVVAGLKLASALSNITSPLKALGDFVDAAKDFFKDLGKAAKQLSKATSNYLNSKALLNIAYAIGILAAALIALSFIDPGKLWSAVGAITVMGIVLGGLAWVIGTIPDSDVKNKLGIIGLLASIGAMLLLVAISLKTIAGIEDDNMPKVALVVSLLGAIVASLIAISLLASKGDLESVSKFIIAVGVAMLLMSVVAKKAGSMGEVEIIKAGAMIAAFGGIIVGLVAATKLASDKELDSVSRFVMKAGLAMLLMVLAAKIAGGMSEVEIIKAAVMLAVFGGIIVGLVAMTKLASDRVIYDVTQMIFSVGVAFLAMAFAAKILGGMGPTEMVHAAQMLLVFTGVIAALIFATRLAGKNKLEKVASSLLAMAVTIGILALVVTLLGLLEADHLLRGGVAVAALAVIVGLLVAMTRGVTSDAKNTLIGVAIAIGVMAAAVTILSFLPVDKMAASVTAIGALMVVLIFILQQAKQIDGGMGPLIALTAMIAILAAAIIVMAKITDPNAALKSALALGGLMIVMAGVLAVVAKIGKKAKDAIKGALALTLMALPLIAFVGVLLVANGITNAMANVKALSVLAAVMTVLMVPLIFIGKFWKDAMLGALALTLMAVPLLAFVGVLALMKHVEVATEKVYTLVGLMTAMTLLLIPLTIIGAFGMMGLPYLGILALTLMAVPMLAFIGVLALMQNLNSAAKNVDLLIDMMTTMTGLLVILAAVGPMALVGVTALAALEALMVATGALAVAVGALLTQFPDIQKFLDTGLPVIEQLAEAIGSIIGKLIGGFAEGVMSTLPAIGTHLSNFMANASGFIEGARNIDDKVISGVDMFSKAILLLTAADLLAGISSFIQGGSSFATLGTDLSKFMTNAKPFIDGAAGLTSDMTSGVKALAETVLILTAADVIEGLTSWITGGASLESFGEQLPALGTGLANFRDALGEAGFTEDDLGLVTNAAEAVRILVGAGEVIPNSGGVLGWIMGENDLGTFAAQFPTLATALVNFKAAMGTANFTDADLTLFKNAAEAVKILAGAGDTIPNSGGVVGWIVGENDLATFASQFPSLATGLAGFKNVLSTAGVTITSTDMDTFKNISEVVKSLAAAGETIPNEGGVVGWICGENSLGKFAESFPVLATGLAGFKKNLGTWTPEDTNMMLNIADIVGELADVAGVIDDNDTIWSSYTEDFASFLEQIPAVGTAIKNLRSNAGGTATVDSVAPLLSAVEELVWSLGAFDADDLDYMTNVVEVLPDLGTTVKAFGEAMASVDTTSLITYKDKVQIISNALTVATNAPTSGGLLGTVITDPLTTLANRVSKFYVAVCSISPSLVDYAFDVVNNIITMFNSMGGVNASAVATFNSALDDIVNGSISNFVSAFSGPYAISGVTAAVTTMITAAATAIDNTSGVLESAVSNAANSAVSKVVASCAYGIGTHYMSMYYAGQNVVQGLANGISGASWIAEGAAAAAMEAAIAAAKEAAGIESPSKEFYKLGEFSGQGLVNGLNDYGDKSYKAGAGMAKSAMTGLKKAISKVYDIVSNEMDAQPTIRPVLDLSNIEYGAGAINRMLSMNPSVGVLGNARSAGYMMNQRIQNGSNRDVVSAIDKLRGDMSGSRGDTYNINGITYDDGSNISEAVRTIVRVARIERRR